MGETFYKVTHDDGRPCNGGIGRWALPDVDTPGWWMPPVTVFPCQSGYHLCTADQLVKWMGGEGTTVWLAEGRGERVDAGDKTVFAEARLIRPVLTGMDQLLLASDFAAHVARFTTDVRVSEAIRATRGYAHGSTDRAAWDASGAAAGDAAWDASGDAAWYAARSATRYAARDAAEAAAWESEREWQRGVVRAVIAGRRKPGTVRIPVEEADRAS